MTKNSGYKNLPTEVLEIIYTQRYTNLSVWKDHKDFPIDIPERPSKDRSELLAKLTEIETQLVKFSELEQSQP